MNDHNITTPIFLNVSHMYILIHKHKQQFTWYLLRYTAKERLYSCLVMDEALNRHEQPQDFNQDPEHLQNYCNMSLTV